MAETADQQRIRALEAEVASLKAKVNPQPTPVAPPPIQDGPRVTFPRTSPIELPSDRQYQQLLAIVARVHPSVVPRDHDREFFLGFVGSFERIAHLRRSDEPNRKMTAYDWATETHRWLRERDTPAEATNGSFFAAVIAAGDVAFSLGQRNAGLPALVGLTYDRDCRTAMTAGWRGVLERGQPRPPTNAVTTREPLPTPTVRYIDGY
jgi:hypothetical protein